MHFFFRDGEYEGEAVPWLWDEGAYFDDEGLGEEGLSIFAHFVRNDTEVSQVSGCVNV